MKCTVLQATFPSNNQKSDVSYYIYQNDALQPKAIIQIAHGMTEYFLRYDEFARFLVDHGYIVCGNDHIGHGNSVKKSKDLGFFANKDGAKYLVEDVHSFTQLLKKHYPEVPVVILGHSMGSFITRIYLDGYSHEVDAAILSGTGNNPLASFGKIFVKTLKWFYGDYHRSKVVEKLSSMSHKYKENTHHPQHDWLTKDTNIIDDYASDDKCRFIFTLSGFEDLFTLVQTVSSKKWGQKIRKDLPIYIFSGEEDPVGDFGKGVKSVYEHLKKQQVSDVTLKLYEKGRHEMLNETNRQEVYNDVLSWLDNRYEKEKQIG